MLRSRESEDNMSEIEMTNEEIEKRTSLLNALADAKERVLHSDLTLSEQQLERMLETLNTILERKDRLTKTQGVI